MQSARPLRARAASSGEHTTPPPVAPEKPVGNIDGVADGVVFGWIAGTAKTELSEALPEIEIQVAGQKIASARLGPERSDIVAQGIADTAYSFHCDLKPCLATQHADASPAITLTHVASGQPLAGSPLNLNATPVWGNADNLKGIELHGWATLAAPHARAQHASVELWIDDAKALAAPAQLPRADFARIGVTQSRCGFKIGLPARYLDGQPHTATLRHQATGEILANGQQSFTATLRHAITYANGSVINGWIYVEETPLSPLALEAWENGCRIASAQANQPHPSLPLAVQQQLGIRAAGHP